MSGYFYPKKVNFRVIKNALLFIFIFFSIYLDISVGYGDLKIPSGLAIFSLCFLPNKIKALYKCMPVLISFFLCCCISYAFGDANPLFTKVLSSVFQTAWCIYFSVLIFVYVKSIPIQVLDKVVFVLLCLLGCIIVLELAGLISSASKWFGENFYGSGVGFNYYGSSLVTSDRDLELAGFRRPTAFSPEPSTAALGISILFLMHYFLMPSMRRLIWVSIGFLGAWFIFRSPTPLLAFLMMFALSFVTLRIGVRKILYLLFSLILLLVVVSALEDRIGKLFVNSESIAFSSEGIRIVLPFVNLYGSLEMGNYLGAGPGAQYDKDFVYGLNSFDSDEFGTNAVGLLLFYFGPFLCIGLIAIFFRTYRRVGLGGGFAVQFFLIFMFVGFSLGAIESVRVLGYVSLLIVTVYQGIVRERCGV